MSKIPSRVLTIAGSDSGGGAGIQADLKTITALGGFAMSALTALTAQNTCEVRRSVSLDPDFVRTQIDVVVEDIGVDAAKTGMLANSEITRAVAERLRHHRIAPLVVDPVMIAKTGAALLPIEATQTLTRVLLPLATVVTPNLREAEALCQMPVQNHAQMREAAAMLHDYGPEWVLVKGGHLDEHPVDILYDGTNFYEVSRPRIDTKNTHGTGCTYASAIATMLAFGEPVPEAVEKARDAVQRAISKGLPLGSGAGPVNHYAIFTVDAPPK